MNLNSNQLADELGKSIGRITQLYAFWAKQQGINYNILAVLYSVWQTDGCSQKQICEEWMIPKQTVSTVCRELKDAGKLTFEPDPQDKRGKVIRLTKTGRDYAAPFVQGIQRIERRVFQNMGPEMSEWLVKSNRRFCELLEEEVRR